MISSSEAAVEHPLKRERRAAHRSQQQLSTISRVRRARISLIEAGLVRPSPIEAALLSAALQGRVTVEELLGQRPSG